MSIAVISSLLLLLTAFCGSGWCADISTEDITAAIQKRIKTAKKQSQGLCCDSGERLYFPAEVRIFYSRRGFHPVWTDGEGPLPLSDSMMKILRNASRHGLRPEDYHLASIEELLTVTKWKFFGGNPLSAEKSTDLEFLMTDAFFLYASHLASGKVKEEKKKAWFLRERNVPDLTRAIEQALEPKQMEAVLESTAPYSLSYVRLVAALRKYREIDRKGGWPIVPAGAALKKGNRSERVSLLRERLKITGELPRNEDSGEDLFDDSLEKAVKDFQQSHGINVDGIVGTGTLEALNVTAAERIRQIEVNLERLRWMPEDLGGDMLVIVNIPEFRLRVVEDGKERLSSKIVVGKYGGNTPVFNSSIKNFIVNPYWSVPHNIAAEEVLPLIKKSPEYLPYKGMKVFSGTRIVHPWTVDWEKVTAQNFKYQLRQEPGPRNPLGRIKFNFPNPFDVYLHDTPDRRLFEWEERNFSHGCIRVENPTELAVVLLGKDPEKSRKQILSAMETGKETVFPLVKPVGIYVIYFTAWVDDEGKLQLRKDIYNHDAPVRTALERPVQPPDQIPEMRKDTPDRCQKLEGRLAHDPDHVLRGSYQPDGCIHRRKSRQGCSGRLWFCRPGLFRSHRRSQCIRCRRRFCSLPAFYQYSREQQDFSG
jgi:murein L,D-transpeptidase YcbB/YkuD